MIVRDVNEVQLIIESVRTLVMGEKNIRCPLNDEYLIRFIRASNYDVNKSFELVLDYFKAKRDHPEEFIYGQPTDYISTVSRLELGFILKECDFEGRRICLLRLGNVDPTFDNWKTLMQSAMLALEALSLDEDCQEAGACLVLDCTNFSLKIMKWATPHKLKVIMKFLQEALPLRFEALHIVNAPLVFNVFYAAIKPFANDTFIQKVHWHKEPFTKLHEYMDPILLPTWMGGTLALEDVKYWYKDIIDKEEILKAYTIYGYQKTR